jgi:hypothetical protein
MRHVPYPFLSWSASHSIGIGLFAGLMSQADASGPLTSTLWDLYDTVTARPDQTVHRMAEQAVSSWTHVLDGKGMVQPRLNASGYIPSAFHFGIELKDGNRLDASPHPAHGAASQKSEVELGLRSLTADTSGGDAEAAGNAGLSAFRTALARRLETLGALLERFFGHTGYRNSTDQCDQLMVELSYTSRFLGVSCMEVERTQGDGSAGHRNEAIDLFAGTGRDTLLFEARFQRFYWEPFLNDAIVAWQQNSLQDYLRALRHLHEALTMPAAMRHELPHEAGYPCRALGKPRHKVIVIRPEARPLRGKSMFELRVNQLLRKVETHPSLQLRLVVELEREIRHFIHMVHIGVFTVAMEPSFQDVGRQALALIRTKPRVHPFLLDPVEFFKKALLFFNGTYTIAGGGLDPMYLQMRQLERYYRFDHWASARGVRAPLEASLIGWEENRWDTFTAGVLRVAEIIRDSTALPPQTPLEQWRARQAARFPAP